MNYLVEQIQKEADPKVFEIFKKFAGKKLDRAAELAMNLHGFEELSIHRAMAEALEQLNLLPKPEIEEAE